MTHPVIETIERTGYPPGYDKRTGFTCSECECEIAEDEKYFDFTGIGGTVICSACIYDFAEYG